MYVLNERREQLGEEGKRSYSEKDSFSTGETKLKPEMQELKGNESTKPVCI